MTDRPLRVVVAGLWHLGCVAAACLAKVGHRVVGVDADADRVASLRAGRAPLREPGLDALLGEGIAAGRLHFTGDFHEAFRDADVAYLAYDTPVDERDRADVSVVLDAAEAAGRSLPPGALLLVQSQVPVGTCRGLRSALRARRGGDVCVAYVPENLRLGQAIERYLHPDMLVVGTDDPEARERVDRLFAAIEAPRVRTDLATAEMAKHAINTFLATSISFANELANLSQLEGADTDALLQVLRLERRIGPRVPLAPGMGFAGGTLARDVKALEDVGERHGYAARLLEAVLRVNDGQQGLPIRWLEQAYGTLAGRRVGVLGLTYKPGTSTLRRSSSVAMIRRLVQAGAVVSAADPEADLDEIADLPPFEFGRDPYRTAVDADALVVATPWPEFAALDYARLRAGMRHPLVLDMPRLLDRAALEAAGFTYVAVGLGAVRRISDP